MVLASLCNTQPVTVQIAHDEQYWKEEILQKQHKLNFKRVPHDCMV